MTIPHRCPVCNGQQARSEREIAGYGLVRCVECGMVYAWPRPERDASRASYAKGRRGAGLEEDVADLSAAALFARYEREMTPYVRHARRRRLERLARLRPIRRMLDFGCGSGHLLGLAREVLGCETFGVELHPAGAVGARRFGFTLHAGQLEVAPFTPASFDLVYSAQVLEHLPEPRGDVGRLAALLAPGGLLFVELPNYGSLSIRLGRDRFECNRPPGHLNFFERGSLARLLREAGLEIVALRTTGLPYRALLGLRQGAYAEAPAVRGPGATLPGSDTAGVVREDPGDARTTHVGREDRARLQLVRSVDALLGAGGWGMQLEAIARRPPVGG